MGSGENENWQTDSQTSPSQKCQSAGIPTGDLKSTRKKKGGAAVAADELQCSVQYLHKSCDFPPLGNLHARTHARAQTWTPVRGTASRLPGGKDRDRRPGDAPGTGAGILF